MENSEMQKQVVNLGKLFVKELGLEQSSDTFSRWMAHYIAEKITVSENSQGKMKEEAERECFDTILKLWKHRWSLPYGKRPLEDFEPLLNLLQKINPEKEEPYFYPVIPSKELSELNNLDNSDSANKWLSLAKEIDKAARIWIDYSFKQAAINVKSENLNEWLENAVQLSGSHDIRTIRVLYNEDSSSERDESLKESQVKSLKEKIDHLEKFCNLSEILLNSYKNELSDILKKKSEDEI